MRLQRLTLKDFQGGSLTIEPNGSDMQLFGINGAGKTRILSALTFLIYGKDALDRTDFDILPHDEAGGRIASITEASVEAVFEVEGKPVTLKKVYFEKWTTRRNSHKKEYTGNEVKHYVNGVPVKKGEYEDAIDELAGREETYKMLTNPRYVPEVMKWTDRRALVVKVGGGDITEADIIASNSDLADLLGILKGRTIDQHKAAVTDKKKTLTKEKDAVPNLIAGIKMGFSETNADPANTREDLIDLRKQRGNLQDKKQLMESGGGVAEKTKELREVEARIQELENAHQKAVSAADQGTDKKLRELNNRVETLKDTITRSTKQIDSYTKKADQIDAELVSLRKIYHDTDALTFEYRGSDTCPACNRPLPSDQVESAKAKALAAFNLEKSQKIEKIEAEGKRTREIVDGIRDSIAKAVLEQAQDSVQLSATEKEIADFLAQPSQSAIAYPPEYANNLAKKVQIEAEIANLKAGSSQEIGQIKDQLSLLDKAIAENEKTLAQFEAREKGQKRIEELSAKEKALSKELEQIERELWLCEEFTRTQARALEGKINEVFAPVNWRLFETTIQGAVVPCCEAIWNGSAYSSAASNGERIKAGLHIIRALQNHEGFHPPVFVDNAEGLTDPPEMPCQTIMAFVRQEDKVLRVEYAKEAVRA